MKKVKEFTIYITTKDGIVLLKKRGIDFKDVFLKLSYAFKMCDGCIEDDDGETITFNQILGIQEY